MFSDSADRGSQCPKVCVVSSLYHPDLGGLGRQAVLLTEHLARSGVPLFVIARKMRGVPPTLYDSLVDIVWIPAPRPFVHILEDKSFPNLVTSIAFSLGALYVLWKKRREYQLVHFFGASVPLMFCILPLVTMRKGVIAMVAGFQGTEAGSLRGRYGPLSVIMLWLLRKVDRFIAISREIERGLKEDRISADRIVQIPIFVEETFSPATEADKILCRREKGLAAYRWVTFSGRLVSLKGLEILLRAWVAVGEKIPDARLLILGEGPSSEEYKRLTEILGISEKVEFRGRVTDVAVYLQASDLFVFPSFQEGLPGSLLEAMACGLPTVASRIGGVVDVIQSSENGLLFTPGSPDELSRALIHLLQNPTEAQGLGLRAAQAIRGHYGIEAVAGRYLDLYRKVSSF